MTRHAEVSSLVDIKPVPVQTAWESPLIIAERFKQGTVQWSMLGAGTGVVNPATARVVGMAHGDSCAVVGQASRGGDKGPLTYVDGYLSVAGNPGMWEGITFAQFNVLPGGGTLTGTLQITNTRGFTHFRLVWDITSALDKLLLSSSFLGD